MPYRRRASTRRKAAPRYRRRAPVRKRRRVAKTTRRRAPVRRRAASKAPSSWWKTIGKVSRVAGAVSPWLPQPYGSIIKTGSLVGSIVGYGDYKTPSGNLHGNVPQIRNSSTGTIIRHAEYICDISSGAGNPTAFNNQAFALNPGHGSTFPWLHEIANNFEEYEFRGLVFEYKTMSVDAIASSSVNVGSVIMATDYNVNHAPFTSKQQMENYEFCTSGKPSQTTMHMVETARSQTPLTRLYVRNENPTSFTGQDLRLYDLGLFQIATQGLPAAAASIGELWVTYEVEFFKPCLPAPLNSNDFPCIHLVTPQGGSWANFSQGQYGYSTGASSAYILPAVDNTLFSNAIYGPLVYDSFFNSVSNIMGQNTSVALPGQPQPGQVGLLATAGGGVNKIYMMYDDTPHVYCIVWLGSGAGAFTVLPNGLTRQGCSSATTWYPTNSLFVAPQPVGTTNFVSAMYNITVPAFGSSTTGANCGVVFVSTPAVGPVASSDLYIFRIS